MAEVVTCFVGVVAAAPPAVASLSMVVEVFVVVVVAREEGCEVSDDVPLGACGGGVFVPPLVTSVVVAAVVGTAVGGGTIDVVVTASSRPTVTASGCSTTNPVRAVDTFLSARATLETVSVVMVVPGLTTRAADAIVPLLIEVDSDAAAAAAAAVEDIMTSIEVSTAKASPSCCESSSVKAGRVKWPPLLVLLPPAASVDVAVAAAAAAAAAAAVAVASAVFICVV